MTELGGQEIYRAVLDALPVAVCAVNRDGRVVLWNEGAERVTGYLRQDVLGRSSQQNLLQYCDLESNALNASDIPLQLTLREGHGITALLSLRSRTGHFVPVRVQTAVLRDDNGSVVGAFELLQPVSPADKQELRQSKLGAYGCLDSLTGAFNHSLIQAHLREHLNLYIVYPVPFCVLCFGIDNLAHIRERYGQAAVDATVRDVVQAIEKSLRPTDSLGRWLDQEFLVVLTECNETDVLSVANRLGKVVRNVGVPWWGGIIRTTISIGATVVHDLDTVGSIVGRAEQALRESTSAGGDRFALVVP
jgi:diguanylate cyclase (GGDEF)-like protein/PAS domain S-box-containing protein